MSGWLHLPKFVKTKRLKFGIMDGVFPSRLSPWTLVKIGCQCNLKKSLLETKLKGTFINCGIWWVSSKLFPLTGGVPSSSPSTRRHLVIVHPNVVPEALDMHGPVKRNVLGRNSEWTWWNTSWFQASGRIWGMIWQKLKWIWKETCEIHAYINLVFQKKGANVNATT